MVEKGKKSIGRGEAGGIALAKTYDGILASNNYKDIAPYIEKYNLKHTDTGQILREALDTRLITESEGNNIWAQMLAKRRKLPANSFSEYLADVNNSNSRAESPNFPGCIQYKTEIWLNILAFMGENFQ